MTFNSIPFLIFLPIVLALYHLLPFRWQNRMLLLASYVFYGWWDWRFLFLLLFSTSVDYAAGVMLSRSEDQLVRKRVLAVTLAVNLVVLGFFKYLGFFVDSMRTLLGGLGYEAPGMSLEIVLPIGISFYTFQSMSYSLDVYRRRMEAIRNFADFSLFVTYFPQLVAGPIERATNLLPQLIKPRVVTGQMVLSGLWLILLGFFRKVAVADAVAPYVNESFNRVGNGAGGLELLGAVYLFAIQIYGDFSGYSDIARGCSRLLGIELMVNFRRPYFAASVTDFWRRWHISLSTFLRDYLYIPLGGSRGGSLLTYRNLMITMLLGGLWHGANWTFVVWGGLHGLFLAVHRLVRGSDRIPAADDVPSHSPVLRVVSIFVCFQLVSLTWVFFRAASVEQAWQVLRSIATVAGSPDYANLMRFAVFGMLLFLVDFAQEKLKTDEPFPLFAPAPLAGAVAALAILCLFIFGGAGNAFIYFQF
jgi:alginate O-acetyltransferase complex protein AlgI